MRIKDVKILWGRAANRCAFPDCRIELTPDGATNTLGEIAHIIAESPNGPRGDKDMSLELRDDYSNLILLCPTHHRMIDNNPEEWTAENLKRIKQDHEKWVSRQLDEGRITIPSIDNSVFLESRKKEWSKFSENYVWVITSITPLNISADTIDPLDANLVGALNSLELPRNISSNPIVNRYHTRPNEYGIINEDIRNITDGSGHRIQIFRNGHCEFLICLEESTREITKFAHEKHREELKGIRILRYTDIAECFVCQIQGLKNIWNNELPFNDMSITTVITNTNSTRLYSKEKKLEGPIFGFTVNSNTLENSDVINKKADIISVSDLVIKRFINHFGLIVDTVFNDKEDLIRPKRLF
jgi:hypothetical protein